MDSTETTEVPETENMTPYKFRIRVSDELYGCAKSPKQKSETLEILHSDLLASFGEQYEILEFEEISEEEWEEAVTASAALDFSEKPTPTLN